MFRDVFCAYLQCATYKEQYDAAAQTTKELQTQLDELAQLQPQISEAHDIQVCLDISAKILVLLLIQCNVLLGLEDVTQRGALGSRRNEPNMFPGQMP